MSRMITDSRERNEYLSNLTRRAESGTLTEKELSEAIDVSYKSDHVYPESVGTEWIHREPELFSGVVTDVFTFLWEHRNTNRCGLWLIHYAEVLAQIETIADRTVYVREVYLTHGDFNYGWVRAALEVEIPRPEIAKMFLERLEATTVQSGIANDVDSFLRSGSGGYQEEHIKDMLDSQSFEINEENIRRTLRHSRPSVDENPELSRIITYLPTVGGTMQEDDLNGWVFDQTAPWSVFDDESIKEAFMICVRKSPKEALRHSDSIERRLRDCDATMEIRVAAANLLTSVHHQELSMLRTLPLDCRVALCKRLVLDGYLGAEITIRFVVDTTLACREPFEFFVSTAKSLLDGPPATVLFRQTRGFAEKMPQWLTDYLLNRLEADGYAVGRVREGEYQRRRQWYIQKGDVRCVQNRNQHRYFPQEGDLVAVREESSRFLARHGGMRIFAADFIPLEKELRSY